MNKSLKNITLRQRYAGIISLKTFKANIFQIYTTQYLDCFLMEKIRYAWYKVLKSSFSKETFLVPPTLTNFTQRNSKIYDTNY